MHTDTVNITLADITHIAEAQGGAFAEARENRRTES